jgi:alpha-tubulin suppressor-like RCC1 family protein
MALALLANGSVLQWGTTPVTVPRAARQDVVRIHASQMGSFAWLSNGTLVHWGTGLDAAAARNLEALNAEPGILSVANTEEAGYAVLLANGTMLNYTRARETPTPTQPVSRLDEVVSLTTSGWDAPTFVAVLSNGSVRAWGEDGSGQASLTTAGAADVVLAAGGGYHTLLLRRNGTLQGFGDFNGGPVVSGSQAGLSSVVKLGSGLFYAAALTSDGRAHMWGWINNAPPVLSKSIRTVQHNVAQLSSGNNHALMLLGDSRVVAMGQDVKGSTLVPVEVQGNAVAVAAGMYHSLVLQRSGRVVSFGRLDDSTVPAAARSNVRLISAGDQFSVAVLSNNSVVVWGEDDPVNTCSLASGIPDFGGANITDIRSVTKFVVVLLSSGDARAWGCNGVGQTALPDEALFGGNVAGIGAGDNHTVLLMKNGRVVGFGDDLNNQISVNRANVNDGVAVFAGRNTTMVQRRNGEVQVFGMKPRGLDVLPLPRGARLHNLAVSTDFTLGLLQLAGASSPDGDATASSQSSGRPAMSCRET